MEAQRVALITGAGSGIGRAAAVLLAQAGYAVALAGRREAMLQETAALLGGARSLVIAADVADAGRCAGMVDRAAEGLGRLDVLVNNAGYAPNVPVEAHTAELLREVYAVNALGPAVAIARAWPVFTRQRSGCVVNVTTLGTLDPFPGFFGYAAAKAAANVMVKSCATEGRAIGVRAFAVAPGAVETAMLRSFVPESVLPIGATLRPEDVARVVLACVQGERDADSGRVIVVEKGGIRLAP